MTEQSTTSPAVQLRDICKYFGTVVALEHVDIAAYYGEVHCLLGDNGAGKSTLIKIISGVFPPDKGEYLFEDKPVRFSSPRDALDLGIATVYQDLAMIPLMSISRNFFLGSEPTKGWGPFKRFDLKFADRVTTEELGKMGINVRDTQQAVGTLSGGSGNRLRLLGRSITARRCLFSMSRLPRLASKRQGWCCDISRRRGRGALR